MAIKRTIKRNYEEEFPTIYSALYQFIEAKEAKNLAKISIHDYEQSVHFFMNFFHFDEMTPLHVVENQLFRTWTKEMLASDLKPSSINRYLRDCRVFFNWCIDNGLLHLQELKIDTVKVQETSVKAFPEDDIWKLIDQPTDVNDFVDWRTWTVVHWILGTGNRASTVCDIRLGDIDFKNKEIMLRHTKNKKAQIIPLSATLEDIIKQYIRIWRYGCTQEDFLFPNTANEYLTPAALTHSFAKYCKARGCTHTNIHGLRHSFALNYIRNGGNQFKLQRILGHSTLDMTNRYVALATSDLKDGFEQFSMIDKLKHSKKPKKLIVRA